MSESLERAKNVISDYQTDMDGSFENAAILEREFQVLLRAHETAMARITELESKPFPHCDKCGSSAWWCNGCSAEKALIERHDRNITDAAIEIVAVRKERDEATSDVLRLRDIVRGMVRRRAYYRPRDD